MSEFIQFRNKTGNMNLMTDHIVRFWDAGKAALINGDDTLYPHLIVQLSNGDTLHLPMTSEDMQAALRVSSQYGEATIKT